MKTGIRPIVRNGPEGADQSLCAKNHDMKKRSIFLYWLILFLPTLVIAAGGIVLLRGEEERLAQVERSSARDRARAIAETLQVTVDAVEHDLTEALRQIPSRGMIDALLEWKDTNPLIRNVFVWKPKAGLQFPKPASFTSTEDRRFIARYQALFSGNDRWYEDSTGSRGTSGSKIAGRETREEQAEVQPKSQDMVTAIRKLRSGRQQLQQMAQRLEPQPNGDGRHRRHAQPWVSQVPSYYAVDPDVTAGSERRVQPNRNPGANFRRNLRGTTKRRGLAIQNTLLPQSRDVNAPEISPPQLEGWIPWFSDNKLHIIGWVRRPNNNDVYGVELELVTLLSRLVVDFPKSHRKGTAYALVDDGGKILHQAGDLPIEPGDKPEVAVSLAPHLPHWQIAVYRGGDGSTAGTARGFIILSGLLLGIFLIAIVTGGTLLTRQAYRSWLDAQQKSSFVSNVSHELKTPLTSIRMYAELLDENRIKDPEKKKQYLRVIVSESDRLGRLVNNVLDFSRLEQGRMKYHPEEIDIALYLREILEAHRLRIKAAGLDLTEQIPEDEITAWVDRDGFKQALINTIDNAIKYAADGGELSVVLEVHDGRCEIKMLDRGPGVPEEHRKSIFEKFHRVDHSLTAQQPGVGLGLTIARRILRDLGGDLLYQPRAGGGSCFILVVPLRRSGTSAIHEKGKRC